MSAGETTTCWTLIHLAASGSDEHRGVFGSRYMPPVLSYLRRRWAGWPIAREIEDAAQDVFLECFRADGVLEKANSDLGSFQAFLLATTRNIARRYEERASGRRECSPAESTFLRSQPSREESLSVYFDRSWAQNLMVEATRLMKVRAREGDTDAIRRFELLQLRFEENVPIHEIAKRWGQPGRQVHDAYALARREFFRCLRSVVGQHGGASGAALDFECKQLVELLG